MIKRIEYLCRQKRQRQNIEMSLFVGIIRKIESKSAVVRRHPYNQLSLYIKGIPVPISGRSASKLTYI